MLTKNKTNNVKSAPIKISNILGKNQYSLKQNLFDPTKNSPPNIFMIKLYNRITKYETNYKNDANFETI
jgi:hypothetical protein